jgi:predicted metal-dependent enzyme (double-stranded beta helix superfamily)
LHGNLTETLYQKDSQGDELLETSKSVAHANDVCYINDSYGFHKMSNDSESDLCVTMHIYSPPYQFCNAYNMDGSKRQVCMLAANAPYEAFFDVGPPRDERSLERFSKQLQVLGDAPVNRLEEDLWASKIHSMLQEMTITEQEWQKYTHFSEYRYTRSMVYSDSSFSVIICCWMPGQKNPIHVHGKGTHSWFRVLAGQLELSFFDNDHKLVSTTTFNTASPAFFEGEGQEFHSVGNNSPNIAVSIHVYSPPYKHLQYNFLDRAASMEVIPVSYCDKQLSGNTCGPACKPNCSEVVFTGLETFQRLLEAEFEMMEGRPEEERMASIMDLLERSTFADEEIAGFSRLRPQVGDDLLLHRTNSFMVTLQFWKRGHQTAIHDHSNASTWVKVLRGRLSDISYDCNPVTGELGVARTSMLLTDSLSFMAKNLKHALRNGTLCEAVSLHITSPPIDRCNHYSTSGVAKSQMFVFTESKPHLKL